jgi:hypothetical protein
MPDIHAAPNQAQTVRPCPSGWRKALGTAILLLALLVALASYRYLFDVPPIPPSIAANHFRRPWLVLHAAAASTALLTGALQFGAALPRRWWRFHRQVGRAYVIACLLGAGSGLVLAAGSSAGPIATAGFGSLAVAWFAMTMLGWTKAQARDFAAHRRWMIRSWALTLAAVTLRIYIPLGEVFGATELVAYRAISFLCWIPNLIAADMYLRADRRRSRS